MMIIGVGKCSNPTVHIPHILPWNQFDDSTSNVVSPLPISSVSGGGDAADSGGGRGDYSSLLASLQCYVPTNDVDEKSENDILGHECDIPVDAYSCDEFRMYEFKVRRCARGRSHDWTECPFVHSGEKARRRDPRKYHYYGTACPDFRKGNCKRGDSCEFAHGVFECWLHPARYRTQPCKDGTCCRRRVCFFAHTPEQLRVLSQQNPSPSSPLSPELFDGSPFRRSFDSFLAKGSTISSDSPLMSPKSPSLSRTLGSNLINETLTSLRHLQLSKVKSLPSTWGAQMGSGSGFCSPRTPSILRPEFYSMPSTPSTPSRSGPGYFDMWDRNCNLEEEHVMERVESGRDLREKIYEKLTRDNSIDRASMIPSPAPDVGWLSELIKRN